MNRSSRSILAAAAAVTLGAASTLSVSGNAEAACIGGAKEEIRERCERARESRGGRNREARLRSGETGLTGGEG